MQEDEKYKAEKRSDSINFLVYHCFALTTPQMLELFIKSGTSVHYVIQRNGTILNLVEESDAAYHAGLSFWRGKQGLNGNSIGIELQNQKMGQQKYTKAQINSLITLSQNIIKRYHIKAQNIVGHSDIAPMRKPDPAKFFPWEQLAENGIGIWPKIKKNTDYVSYSNKEIKHLLEKIGYDTNDVTAALYAFITRFLPKKVTTQKDIINREAEVFAYWKNIKQTDVNSIIKDAPAIYPSSAKLFLHDTEILARLKQVAEAYEQENISG